MCNKIVPPDQRNATRIPETGFGWKIFCDCKGEFSLLEETPYKKDEEGWVNWICQNYEGFCFFLSKEEAIRAWDKCLGLYWPVYVKKIEYQKGLQERDEEKFVGGQVWRVALCHRFRVVEE